MSLPSSSLPLFLPLTRRCFCILPVVVHVFSLLLFLYSPSCCLCILPVIISVLSLLLSLLSPCRCEEQPSFHHPLHHPEANCHNQILPLPLLFVLPPSLQFTAQTTFVPPVQRHHGQLRKEDHGHRQVEDDPEFFQIRVCPIWWFRS